MRVLCCLDGTNVEQVSKALRELWATQAPTLGILHVTDSGPRHDIGHIRERFLRSPSPHGPREHEMQQAEHAAAQDVLNEALHRLPNAETLQRQGRPEREIVNAAAEWRADLLISLPPRRVRRQTNDWSEISRTCRTICPRPRSLSGAAATPARTRTISYRQVNCFKQEVFGQSFMFVLQSSAGH